MTGRLFCFGLGFSALALARDLMADGWTVAGTTRSEDKRKALEAEGIDVHLFSRENPLKDPAAALDGVTHVVTSIAPDEDGDPVLGCHLKDLLAGHAMTWAGYLGTTGVYGDRQGGWVDETAPPAPSLPRTKRRVAAEGHWLASGLPVHIFRLAGIYGPGPRRNALETVKSGRARRLIKPGQMFGRIHVDDIVQVLKASIARPKTPAPSTMSPMMSPPRRRTSSPLQQVSSASSHHRKCRSSRPTSPKPQKASTPTTAASPMAAYTTNSASSSSTPTTAKASAPSSKTCRDDDSPPTHSGRADDRPT